MIVKLINYLRSPEGAKLIKYAASSVITTIMTMVIIVVTFDWLQLFSASFSSFFASACSIPPSYYLNRKWAWGKSGKSHLLKEIAPFWAMALIGLALATISADYAAKLAHHITNSRDIATIFVVGANFMSYGILWSIRFIILNKLLFKTDQPKSSSDEYLQTQTV
jgi:putative flippase GtrA